MGAKVGAPPTLDVREQQHSLILSCLPLGSQTGIDHQGGAVAFARLPAAVYPDLPAGEAHPELPNHGAPAPVRVPLPGLGHIPGGHRERRG